MVNQMRSPFLRSFFFPKDISISYHIHAAISSFVDQNKWADAPNFLHILLGIDTVEPVDVFWCLLVMGMIIDDDMT